MKRLEVGLDLALHLNKTHRWPQRCLRDRLGVAVVVLLGLDVRADIFRRHQPDLVSLRCELLPQVMRTATRFHRHHATRGSASKLNQPPPLQPAPHQHPPIVVQSHHAADILAQIDPKHRDIHRSAPPLATPTILPDRFDRGGPSHNQRSQTRAIPSFFNEIASSLIISGRRRNALAYVHFADCQLGYPTIPRQGRGLIELSAGYGSAGPMGLGTHPGELWKPAM
jgi:hypothetical protein